MKHSPDNTGKVHTKYIRAADGTAVTLNYRPQEAKALRAFVQSIRLRGDKVPSLSLIARRSMQVYMTHIQFSPSTLAAEVEALERIATPFSDRAQTKPLAA
jgi:predicted N-acetyltransferase YhbS